MTCKRNDELCQKLQTILSLYNYKILYDARKKGRLSFFEKLFSEITDFTLKADIDDRLIVANIKNALAYWFSDSCYDGRPELYSCINQYKKYGQKGNLGVALYYEAFRESHYGFPANTLKNALQLLEETKAEDGLRSEIKNLLQKNSIDVLNDFQYFWQKGCSFSNMINDEKITIGDQLLHIVAPAQAQFTIQHAHTSYVGDYKTRYDTFKTDFNPIPSSLGNNEFYRWVDCPFCDYSFRQKYRQQSVLLVKRERVDAELQEYVEVELKSKLFKKAEKINAPLKEYILLRANEKLPKNWIKFASNIISHVPSLGYDSGNHHVLLNEIYNNPLNPYTTEEMLLYYGYLQANNNRIKETNKYNTIGFR